MSTAPAQLGETRSAGLSAALLALRLVVGGLFLYAAYQKLFSPNAHLNFSESIQAFRVIPNNPDWDWAVMLGTFSLPWVELISGVALVLGIWTRSAGLVASLLMMVFIAAVVSVTERGLDVNCSCFGKFKLLCEKVNWCKVGENSALAAMAVALWTLGGGVFSVDRLLDRKRGAA